MREFPERRPCLYSLPVPGSLGEGSLSARPKRRQCVKVEKFDRPYRRMRRALLLSVGVVVAFVLIAAIKTAIAAAIPPTITNVAFSGIGPEKATLSAGVDPEEKATLYRFEWGSAPCSANPCTKVPVPDGQVPKGPDPVLVEAQLEGLTPQTTYFFRVIAKNGDGTTTGTDHSFTTYAALFEGLPDGRAYEQASPVNKNAGDVRGYAVWVRASITGDAISYLSLSGMPGAEGAQDFPQYLSSRNSTNWSTQGLLPAATVASKVNVKGWTPDFSEVYSLASFIAGPQGFALLARSSADGSLDEVVPYGSGLKDQLSFAGASPDGSMVVFETTTKLLPKAIEGKSNVYLWERATKDLSLISTLNDGNSPPEGAFVGPYDWISGEPLSKSLGKGGASAEYYVQDQRAISTSADHVFFTAAGTGQLYLRRNPTKEQSPTNGEGKCTDLAKACTLHLSASKRTEPDPLGTKPAAFQIASTDGSKALFTSSEELTNDANTGPEAEPAGIARAEIDGDPVDLGFLPASAFGVAVDATHIYWADPVEETIGRAEIDGENPDPDFISVPQIEVEPDVDSEANPQYVAVDSEHIYWTNAANGKDGKGTIARADLDGDPLSVEMEFITGAHNPQGVAVNATHIFWANAGEKVETRTIGRAEIDGGNPEQGFIPVDGGLQKDIPQGVALSPTRVYWSLNNTSKVGYLPSRELDGNAASEEFLSDVVGAELRGIATDATHVYWARKGKNSIGRALLDFTSPEPEFIQDAEKPEGLALNATHLFWSANQESLAHPGNDLYRYDAGAEALTDLTPDATDENGADVQGVLGASSDATHVYFAANGDLDGAGPALPGDCEASVSDGFLNAKGQCSLYLWREGMPITFIAPLDASGGSDATNWLPLAIGRRLNRTARVTPDGQTLLFTSREQLTGYDNEGQTQLYRFRIGEGIGCVSCNPTGAPPGAYAPGLADIGLSFFNPEKFPAFTLTRNLSSDGDRVFFESSDALVAGDVNGAAGCPEEGSPQVTFPTCKDVYEWEAVGSGSCEKAVQAGGCLYLLSTGTSPHTSFFADASASGDDAFIITRSTGLVGQDQDQLYDVFDARVGGGLASQSPPPIIDCESETGCRPPAPDPPVVETGGTATFVGPADPKPKRKAAKKGKGKGKKQGKGKGKKGKGKKAKQHKRAAKKSGGASR